MSDLKAIKDYMRRYNAQKLSSAWSMRNLSLMVIFAFMATLIAFSPLFVSAFVGTGSSGNTRGYWRFNDNANDMSGRGNNATLNGTSYIGGKFGQALNFNGTSDYADCGSDSSLLPTSSITLEAWVYPQNAASDEPVIAKELSEDLGYFLGVYGGKARFLLSTSGTSWDVDANLGDTPNNQWSHIAGVWNGSGWKLFVNGNVTANGSQSGSINSTAAATFVGGTPANSDRFQGIIDEVRILDFARTAFSGGVVINEVSYTGEDKWIELYNHGSANVNIRGWKFLNDNGTTLVDLSATDLTVEAGTFEMLWEHDYGGLDNLSNTDSIRAYDLDPENDGSPVAVSYTNLVDFVGWGGNVPLQCNESSDDAVVAGLWTEDTYQSSTSNQSIYLLTDGNNDAAVNDWGASETSTPGDPVPDIQAWALFTGGLLVLGIGYLIWRKRIRQKAQASS